ncbi:MAG: DNA protecting protein DprA [Acidobacteria bacterium RIFCSPLOWO2_12_FULL_59_11]|nr:MAG: DNA protecting protein DprA [Acidobacteria bacterium RIFCSPLOWO2_12_FULL_59_11]
MNDQPSAATPGKEPEEELHWLALRLVPGLGNRLAKRLVDTLGSATDVFRASSSELESLRVPSHVIRNLSTGTVFEGAIREVEQARQLGIRLLTIREADYPPLLKEIFDPPLVLYVRGELALLRAPAVAVVGTRRTTPYGRAMAERLAADLASRGLVIISGLARGVDAVAHRATLDIGGKTVAVLGNGADVIYPSENKKLFDRIVEQGAIVSEFPLGSFPAPQNFPIRNRIISGLSLGVVVVEAAQHSGALITARLAMEQNREVFAIPGSLTNPCSWGPHVLIKQGAKLVQDWQDVVEELPAEVRQQLFASSDATKPPEGASLFAESLSEQERAIYNLLKVEEAIHLDEILDALPQLSSSEVLVSLLELEFKNLVRQLPGKNFVKIF